MSKYEQKENTGVLFKNDRKETENHPDRTGNMLVKCPHCGNSSDMWLSGWIKKTKNGDPYLSIAFKAKTATAAKPQRRAPEPMDDDSIPF